MRRRRQVKSGGFQQTEAALNEQLLALLSALPSLLLAKCFVRLIGDDVLPEPARFVKRHLGNGEQIVEPDFLVRSNHYLLMGEMKVKGTSKKSDTYDANQLFNLPQPCGKGASREQRIPTQALLASHSLPTIDEQWFSQAGKWIIDLENGRDKRLRIDPQKCMQLVNKTKPHRYMTNVGTLSSVLGETPIYCRTYDDLPKALRAAAAEFPLVEHWEHLAAKLERLAAIASGRVTIAKTASTDAVDEP